MYIKRENNLMVMNQPLVCTNYSDMKHFYTTFEKVSDNEYKCSECGTVMVTRDPILVHDDNGRLKMQIITETLKEGDSNE